MCNAILLLQMEYTAFQLRRDGQLADAAAAQEQALSDRHDEAVAGLTATSTAAELQEVQQSQQECSECLSALDWLASLMRTQQQHSAAESKCLEWSEHNQGVGASAELSASNVGKALAMHHKAVCLAIAPSCRRLQDINVCELHMIRTLLT
jgi:hypothetical protein